MEKIRKLRIISGGQTGADRAALDMAIRWGIPHGGSVPRGRKAEDGVIASCYRLTELASASYPVRTRRNVLDADGTLIVSHGPLTGGSKLTADLAEKHRRPALHIDLTTMGLGEAALSIVDFLETENIATLNVAGPRGSADPEIYHAVSGLLERVFRQIFA